MSEKPAKLNLNFQIKIALLAVIAFVIYFFETPLPLFPDFLKLDASDIPAIIAGFALGPVAGVIVELMKNLLHLFRTSTSGVGELANFLIGGSFVYAASFIYWKNRTIKGALTGLAFATVFMTVVGCLVNYTILIPFYVQVVHFPLDAIIQLGSKVNPAIHDYTTLILYGIAPFNIIKGIVMSVLTLLIYKRISPLLRAR